MDNITWFPSSEESIQLSQATGEPLNNEVRSFLRVKYGEARWAAIINQLNENHLHFDEVTRTQIIDDAFSLARAGQLGYDVAFNTTSYLAQEKEFVPWKAVFRNVG